MLIRAELPRDIASIRAIHLQAFETAAESELVAALRQQAEPCLSLVVERADCVVGNILFSPASLAGQPELKLMGLGPMAVAPDYQGLGIGSALVQAGLQECVSLPADAVVVLGHPHFYPRFGFVPAKPLGIDCEYDVPDEAFMIVELREKALHGHSGRVSYHPAFGQF